MDEIRPHRHHFRINRGQCNRYRVVWYCDICYYKCSAGKIYMWYKELASKSDYPGIYLN